MAVGASRENVLMGVLKNALTVTVVGVVAGLVLAGALTSAVESLLFDVKPLDVAVMSGAVATLLISSTLAAWFPAKRATSVEPMRLLRFE
jgi:putative ABC transport system permease protein